MLVLLVRFVPHLVPAPLTHPVAEPHLQAHWHQRDISPFHSRRLRYPISFKFGSATVSASSTPSSLATSQLRTMDSNPLPHNRELGKTWGLRLGQYIRADLMNRAREGRVGILQNGDFIPLPQPKGWSSVLPDTVPVGNTFNAPVDPSHNSDLEQVLDLAIPNDTLVSGVLPLFETSQIVGNGAGIEGKVRYAIRFPTNTGGSS